MIRSFKVRLFPTEEQEQKFFQHIGCCRFIWNYMIELQQKRRENKEKHLSHFGMTKVLTSLKKEEEYKWLKEVSNESLKIVCSDLSKAYKSFFDKIRGYPKFKSKKHSNKSFPVRPSNFYFMTNDLLNIEKVGKVKYKTNRTFPLGRGSIKVTNSRVKLVGSKWILTFGIECENQTPILNGKIGIDLGIKELAYCSYNGKPLVFHNINKSQKVRKLKSKLKHLQKKCFT